MELKILVVDDVAANIQLMEVLLKKAGNKVIHCPNGLEAVEMCKSQKYDLIIMDIQMPELNGVDATKMIKSDCEVNNETPIIIMTAGDDKMLEVQCLEAGCEDILRKPINKKALLRKINKYIAREKQLEAAERGEDIISALGNDPDFKKTVETFVNTLPDKIRDMQDAAQKGDLDALAAIAHSVKGVGTFAGFPIYTEKAAKIESTAKIPDLDKVREQVDELSKLCMRTKVVPK